MSHATFGNEIISSGEMLLLIELNFNKIGSRSELNISQDLLKSSVDKGSCEKSVDDDMSTICFFLRF